MTPQDGARAAPRECPGCGSPANSDLASDCNGWDTYCSQGCGFKVWKPDREESIAAWNTRPPRAAPGEVEAVLARLQSLAADLTDDGNSIAELGYDSRAKRLYEFAREAQSITDALAAAAAAALRARAAASEGV